MFSWLANAFGAKAKPKRDSLAFASELHWIAARDNPWEVDILDCRAVALHWHSATTDATMANSFGRLRNSDGRHHMRAAPLPHKIERPIVLEIPVLPPEGYLFRATQMEEKWDIYHWAGRLFAARSWTGDLNYSARVQGDGKLLQIDEITTLRPSVDYARKELYFLLRSHVQALLMPAPVPVQDIPDPENRGEKALAGHHLFSTFGRYGWFATVADMTDKPMVEGSVLKTWLEAHPVRKSP